MGTSKSYISLKKPEHTRTKRGLTSYLSGGGVSESSVASRFASSLKAEYSSASSNAQLSGASVNSNSIKSYSTSVARVVGYIGNMRSGGISYASQQAGFKKEPQTVSDLITMFMESDIADTIDASVASEAIAVALANLQITDINDLQSLDLASFTKELLADIIAICFEQRYFEQILARTGKPSDAKRKCDAIKDCIYGQITTNLDVSTIQTLHSDNIAMTVFIEEKCLEALKILMALDDSI